MNTLLLVEKVFTDSAQLIAQKQPTTPSGFVLEVTIRALHKDAPDSVTTTTRHITFSLETVQNY